MTEKLLVETLSCLILVIVFLVLSVYLDKYDVKGI